MKQAGYIGKSVPAVLFLVLSWFVFGGAADGQEREQLVVGTFNIHYVSVRQEGFNWVERREAVLEALREGSADIIGFQEMETFAGGHWNEENIQIDWIVGHFPEYSMAAVGDPRVYPSTQPVFFRSDRFEFMEQGFFFFSSTPDVVYSQPWSGRYPAFCSWVRLRDRDSGEGFYVYNLHFDNSSLENRLKAARLVAERISDSKQIGEPVVVLGDYNTPKLFRPVTILVRAGLKVAGTTGSTYHFNRGINLIPAIDHVLFSEEFGYIGTKVIRRRFQGVWPSDHYPVFVTLAFGG